MRLNSVLLLAGAVSTSPFRRSAGRPVFELPVVGGGTLLDRWISQSAMLQGAAGAGGPPEVRVLLDTGAEVPSCQLPCKVVRDGGEIRGAAGALRDATMDVAEEEWVLAAPASQLLLAPLPEIVAALAREAEKSKGDIVMAASADGTPGFFMLARAGLLRYIPPVGYIDLKEQALPSLSKRGNVRGIRLAPPAAISVRTPTDYLRALRLQAGNVGGGGNWGGEAWQAAFSLAEPGAEVAEGANLHDSVALAGSEVGRDAVLVRCLVCPGARVDPGAVVVDQVITAAAAPARKSASQAKERTRA